MAEIYAAVNRLPATSGSSAERLGRIYDLLLRRDREILEARREGNRHVHRAQALHGRIEVVEGTVRDDGRDLGRDAIPFVALVDHDRARGLLRRLDERRFV